ncbi:plant UBX domain-containing protein 11 isoform X2 [Alnus glutinosa]|nr:plant UBX domain-containing protein 11 isoform X2 [Alnus glutinosa]XP_062144630.1 plant UBX domain-containing protein 11 isoform X2 [Alnus glutinosa]
MEHSLSLLTFKGSITEAIIEAKRQKKLFVVYISGEDAESSCLEESTWTNSNVAESLSKYCILLHIPGGSTDAAHFSALYPQKSVPCITAIGFNGVQVWQNDGFVSAEDLASSLEKAWLSLHIQETTATFLTAALASRNSGASTSSSNAASSNEQSSSSTVVPSPSTDKHVQYEEAKPAVTSDVTEEKKGHECKVEEKDTEMNEKTSSRSYDTSKSKSVVDEQPTSSTKVHKGSVGPLVADIENSRADHNSSSAEDGCPAPEKISGHHSAAPGGGEQLVGIEVKEAEQDEKAEAVNHMQAYASDGSVRDNMPSDVHLNIRLPAGSSLQEKFSVTSTLRMVKDYVDGNLPSGFGTYDLAIPYPRKIFSSQDLSKSLSELGLFNRQTLIVVPHQRGAGNYRGASSSSDQTDTNVDSLDGTNGGYFTYVRRILSYMNPFSYLGGGASSSSSEQESQNGIWQYGPNPTLQNNMAGRERPQSHDSSNQSTSATGRDDGKKKQPTTSRFGSNIHTLKHDEEDDRFNDRNAFWNGNSTQYGGNNDGK